MIDIPSAVEEEAVRKSVFEAVSSKIWCIIVSEREEMIIGNFTGENAIALELAHDSAGVADDLAGAFLG